MNKDQLYDVIVVGGGPAGLTAALYLARANYRVLVIEKEHWGGQITITNEVVNYPGVEHTSGTELTETMRKQAQNFGAEFLFAEVSKLDLSSDVKTVTTARGEFLCFGVLLATGAHPRMVGFAGEEEFRGHGVAYCATCDGEFFTGKDIFVVGGGFAAAEEGVFLTRYARKVTILVREDDFTCAKSAADAARSSDKISVLTNMEVEQVSGDSTLNYIRYRNNRTGEITEYRAADDEDFGVFVFAGYTPATDLIKDIAKLNEQGYVITDERQCTSVPGLYAAGDVCIKSLRQVVTAVGEGALAATELERYASGLQQQTGLVPVRPAVVTGQAKPAAGQAPGSDSGDDLFTDDMKAQLSALFARMAQPMILSLSLDDSSTSAELKGYMETLSGLTDSLSLDIADEPATGELPCVRILDGSGKETGLAFHGVPGGHEFTSFMLGIYNAAGPGQAIDEQTMAAIGKINKPVSMKVLISLSCTMCPELVTAAQHIAAKSELVSAEVYDLNHFPELQKKYNVMSVPCLVINEDTVTFGKKNMTQLLELIHS